MITMLGFVFLFAGLFCIGCYADYRLQVAHRKVMRKRRVDNSLACEPRLGWYRVKDMREGGEYASQYAIWYVWAYSAKGAYDRVIKYGNENLCFSRVPRLRSARYEGGIPETKWIKVLV